VLHSKLGASSMYRWAACPGSVAKCRDIESVTSIYAQEGTDAHKLGELALIEKKSPSHWIGKTIGKTKITSDIANHVASYVATIHLDWPLEDREHIRLDVEKKFNLDWLIPGAGLFGTNDACLCEPFGKLRLYDLKFGYGIVEVVNNPQLLYYATGALGKDDYDEIEMIIVQPRASHPEGPIRRWTVTQEYVMDWVQKVLVPAIEATQQLDAPLIPGDHCTYCPAKEKMLCDTQKKHVFSIAKSDFSSVSNPKIAKPEDLTNEELNKSILKLKLVESTLKSWKEYALSRMKSGGVLPDFKLVETSPRRKWVDEDFVAKTCESAIGDDAYNPKQLKSPNQMETAFAQHGHKPHARKEMLGHLWKKPKGVLDIAPLSDKRQAVKAPISSDFTDVEDVNDFLN